MSAAAKKVTFTMDPEAVKELQTIDKESPSIAQTIRRALKIFKYLKKMDAQGYEIILEKPTGDDGSERSRTKLVIE